MQSESNLYSRRVYLPADRYLHQVRSIDFKICSSDHGELIQYGEGPSKNSLKKNSQNLERIFESQHSILKEISGSKVRQVACNQTAIFALTSKLIASEAFTNHNIGHGEIYSWGTDIKKTGNRRNPFKR